MLAMKFIFKLLSVAMCATCCIYQFQQILGQYFAYKVNTIIRAIDVEEDVLPSVMVCFKVNYLRFKMVCNGLNCAPADILKVTKSKHSYDVISSVRFHEILNGTVNFVTSPNETRQEIFNFNKQRIEILSSNYTDDTKARYTSI